MNMLVATALCLFIIFSHSNESNSTLLDILEEIEFISVNIPNVVTLNRGHVVFSLGILISHSCILTAAHGIHELRRADFNNISIISPFHPTNQSINHIQEIIIDSYKNENLHERGVDFAVLRLIRDFSPDVGYALMSKFYIHPDHRAVMVFWETDSNHPSNLSHSDSHVTVRKADVMVLSNNECEIELGHPIDRSLFCGIFEDYATKLTDATTAIFDGAPLTLQGYLEGIVSTIHVLPAQTIIVFARVSYYRRYILHESINESDSDENESIWSPTSSSTCSSNEQDKS